MLVTQAALDDLFRGFKTVFNEAFTGAETFRDRIAMVVPSMARDETYAWMGQMPNIREWVGDRVVQSLSLHGWTIANRDFEMTVSLSRNDIEDDRYGALKPIMSEMGRVAAQHPDQLLFQLLAAGFTSTCYDGQYFFDTDHPVGTSGGDYPVQSVSNFGGGSGTPWFLLDCSRAIRPLVFQERRSYGFVSLTRPEDENVFFRKEFIYGADGRSNAGFGLWQLAYASKETLNKTSYEAARAAMHSLRGDSGRPLGVRPTHLVIPPTLEAAALTLLNAERDEAGATNVWRNTAQLIMSEYLI